jgi:hypothetical protein
MQVRKLIDSVEQTLTLHGVKHPGREILRSWMSEELSILTGDHEFNWSQVWLDPIIETEIGTREYSLPNNFPSNFVSRGDGYVCILKDSDTQYELNYLSPGKFYSQDLISDTNGLPTDYTITTTESGRRMLVLSPPPDSDTYTVSGLFRPIDWALADQDVVPPMPNPFVLVYAVLRRFPKLQPEYMPEYQQSLSSILMADARDHKVVFSPNIAKYNTF